jgi:hypothetical protein
MTTWPGFGGSGGVKFPKRYDLSVNGSRCEGADTSSALLITQTVVANAGAFNNLTRIGNKAILAIGGHDGLPLGSFNSFSWDFEKVSLEADPATTSHYANIIIDLGAPPGLVIAVLDPSAPVGLNIGTLTNPAPNKYSFVHGPSNYIQIVNAFTTVPPVSPPVPIAAGTNVNWNQAAFKISDILASFPNAKLVDAFTNDGGLPKNVITPAILLASGDSINQADRVKRITNIKLNGADA